MSTITLLLLWVFGVSIAVISYLLIGVSIAVIGSVVSEVLADIFERPSSWLRFWQTLKQNNTTRFRQIITLLWPLVIVSGLLWLFLVDMPMAFFRFMSGKHVGS